MKKELINRWKESGLLEGLENYNDNNMKQYFSSKPSMKLQTLKLAEDVFDQLEYGKSVTIRKGKRDIDLDLLKFESEETKREQIVMVRFVMYAKLKNIPLEDVWLDGFENYEDMIENMKRFYPDINMETVCTVIQFRKQINNS